MNRNYGTHARYVPPGRVERCAVWVASEVGSWGPRLVATYHQIPPPRTVLSYPFTKLIGTLASVALVLTLVGFLSPIPETAVRAQRPIPQDPAPPLVDTLPATPGQIRTRPVVAAPVSVAWELPTIEATQALAPVKPLPTKKIGRIDSSPAPRKVYNWKVPARHDLPRPGHPVGHHPPRTELPGSGTGQHGDHAGNHDPHGLIERLLREARERAQHPDRDRESGGRHSRHDDDSGSSSGHKGSVARDAHRDHVRSGGSSRGDRHS